MKLRALRARRAGRVAMALLALEARACGSSDAGTGGLYGAPGTGGAAGSGAFAGTAGTAGGFGGTAGTGGAPPPPPPPEQELEGAFLSPVATGRYVWTANPDSGRVALIDAETLEVTTVEAGFAPTYLAAIARDADHDAALVLNVLSHDATILRAAALDEPVTLPTHTGANAIATSPGGRWAIAWSDATAIEDPDPTEGFQDVTVIDLEPGEERSTRLSVGYRPTRVFFASSEERAFFVTEPGISVVELDAGLGPRVSALVEVTDDPLESPASRDVTVTPDGELALVRRDGSNAVGLVELPGGARASVALSGAVTDLDLAADGSRAVAVVRENAEVVVLPIPGILDDPAAIDVQHIDGELFGSVSLAELPSVALLYTNAQPNDHLTIVQTAVTPEYLSHRTVALKAPVRAVFPAADARHAVALLEPGASSSKAGAFAVVPTAALLSPKIVGTDAPPGAVAIAPGPESERAVVTVRDDARGRFGAYLVRMPGLQVDLVPLASPPLAAGMVLGAGKAWIAQEHPEGRVTFVDLDDGDARTLTGFELGAKVVD
jgi:DNA-binding beta-propeller fold protein YncE